MIIMKMLIVIMLLIIESVTVYASHKKVIIKVPQRTKHIYHHHVKRVPVYVLIPQKKSKILEQISYDDDHEQPTYVSAPCKEKHVYVESPPTTSAPQKIVYIETPAKKYVENSIPYKYDDHRLYEAIPSEDHHISIENYSNADDSNDYQASYKQRHSGKIKQSKFTPIVGKDYEDYEFTPSVAYKRNVGSLNQEDYSGSGTKNNNDVSVYNNDNYYYYTTNKKNSSSNKKINTKIRQSNSSPSIVYKENGENQNQDYYTTNNRNNNNNDLGALSYYRNNNNYYYNDSTINSSKKITTNSKPKNVIIHRPTAEKNSINYTTESELLYNQNNQHYLSDGKLSGTSYQYRIKRR